MIPGSDGELTLNGEDAELVALRAEVERLETAGGKVASERDVLRREQARLTADVERLTRKLAEAREELSTVKIQMGLIRLGRDWWILQTSRAVSPERFKELQDVPADEKGRAVLGEGETTKTRCPWCGGTGNNDDSDSTDESLCPQCGGSGEAKGGGA